MDGGRTATPSSFDKFRMGATGNAVEILIPSLSKDEDFGSPRRWRKSGPRIS
jgi:hypothetical protein